MRTSCYCKDHVLLLQGQENVTAETNQQYYSVLDFYFNSSCNKSEHVTNERNVTVKGIRDVFLS